MGKPQDTRGAEASADVQVHVQGLPGRTTERLGRLKEPCGAGSGDGGIGRRGCW